MKSKTSKSPEQNTLEILSKVRPSPVVENGLNNAEKIEKIEMVFYLLEI